MRYILLLIITLLITACNNENIQRTKELNKYNEFISSESKIKKIEHKSEKERILKMQNETKIKLEELNLQTKEKIEKLKAQNEQKIKEIELEKEKAIQSRISKETVIKEASSVEVAKINSKTQISVKEKEISMYKIFAIIFLIIVTIWLIIRYLQEVSKRRHAALMKEQELNYQVYLNDSNQKHENISKMLDILADKNGDSSIKKEIAKILTHNKNNLIEHKKK